jgi:hypothetical protein
MQGLPKWHECFILLVLLNSKLLKRQNVPHTCKVFQNGILNSRYIDVPHMLENAIIAMAHARLVWIYDMKKLQISTC